MGRRDYGPFDKHYWKNWAEHNKDYWTKWAEHNKNYWNNPHMQKYGRHFGRGRWIGRIVFFALGFWAGSYVNQRYRLPSASPRETWEEMRTAAENIKRDHPGIRDSPEFSDILDKVKQLEQRYRRQQPPSGDSQAPSSEAPGTKPRE